MQPGAGGGSVVDRLSVSSFYVESLEAQRAALVAALEGHVDDAVIATAHRLSARLSVRLDASPLDDATADAVDRGDERAQVVAGTGGATGWARALKLDGMPSQDIAAVEYHGVRMAQAAEPHDATTFFGAPGETLVRVQRRIAAGLLAEDRLGALRITSRAVHDGAQGMVIYHAPEPQRLPGLLSELDTWIRGARHVHSPLVIAGVVHLRLLHWQPFEAGNGRVARAASRVALRATSGDSWGLASPEQFYARDPLRYVSEVAATIRRRSDLRPWIERTAEAVVASLEVVARQIGVLPDTADVRGVRECAQLQPGETITVRDYAAATGSDRRSAIAQLIRLCWSGLLERDMGTRGLRYVRCAGDGVR
jgi:hypothetical protein